MFNLNSFPYEKNSISFDVATSDDTFHQSTNENTQIRAHRLHGYQWDRITIMFLSISIVDVAFSKYTYTNSYRQTDTYVYVENHKNIDTMALNDECYDHFPPHTKVYTHSLHSNDTHIRIS